MRGEADNFTLTPVLTQEIPPDMTRQYNWAHSRYPITVDRQEPHYSVTVQQVTNRHCRDEGMSSPKIRSLFFLLQLENIK